MGKLLITREGIEEYKTLGPLLDSFYVEVKSFASKKQDGVLSELKVKAINKILLRAKELVKNQKGVEFLELLDSDTLPTNSDAVIVVVQYQSLMNRFKDSHTSSDGFGDWSWNVDKSKGSTSIKESTDATE